MFDYVFQLKDSLYHMSDVQTGLDIQTPYTRSRPISASLSSQQLETYHGRQKHFKLKCTHIWLDVALSGGRARLDLTRYTESGQVCHNSVVSLPRNE